MLAARVSNITQAKNWKMKKDKEQSKAKETNLFYCFLWGAVSLFLFLLVLLSYFPEHITGATNTGGRWIWQQGYSTEPSGNETKEWKNKNSNKTKQSKRSRSMCCFVFVCFCSFFFLVLRKYQVPATRVSNRTLREQTKESETTEKSNSKQKKQVYLLVVIMFVLVVCFCS